jgi:large subunit ribosomal protein L15
MADETSQKKRTRGGSAASPAIELSLSTLRPAQKRRDRKRIGRGMGSGKGRYAGRGIKGQKARSGSNKMRAGFEGGQMPVYMRLGKQRGPTSKDAMPIGPHRTSTQPVNLRELERVFDDGAEVTLDALLDKGLVKNLKADVKILGDGELTKKLTVTAHRFSKTATEKIEAAGGTAIALREPLERKPKRTRKTTAATEPEDVAEVAAGEETEAGEPQSEAEESEAEESEAEE